MATTDKMPTLFIPHGGGPCFFMDWKTGPADTWSKMATWLKQLPTELPSKPKALVVISAHWEEQDVGIISEVQPKLLYDYYGFPEHTYKLEYKATGSPELAKQIGQILTDAGIKTKFETHRGFDHGVFVPLKLVYPDAEIPIVQVSLKKGLEAEAHLKIGEALAPLRDEGILIIGSGMSYHNLRNFGDNSAATDKTSHEFDDWLSEAACAPDVQVRRKLLQNWSNAPSARNAHPREEHLIPLMVAAGAAPEAAGKRIFNEKILGAYVSGYRFG